MKKETLQSIVRETLEKYPVTRDSDITLTQHIWLTHFSGNIKVIDGTPYVALKNLHNIAREDNIKRIRARIQNEEHLFLPTDPKVRERRHIAEEEWLNWARKK
jgi:hypothetical protein